jgi:hypothetical protein
LDACRENCRFFAPDRGLDGNGDDPILGQIGEDRLLGGGDAGTIIGDASRGSNGDDSTVGSNVIGGAGDDSAEGAPGSSDTVDGGPGVGYDIYSDGAGQIVAVEDVIATVNTS